MLEFAVLGLLHESPMHGYELRKRLNAVLGAFRAFSYGSLYPCLRRMKAAGWISEDQPVSAEAAPVLTGRRGKVVYKLAAEGKERLQELLAEAGPSAWEDETFGVHFAFFAQTDADVRLRILEGRRSRLEQRQELLAEAGPSAWEDETFGVHFAFFAQTDADVRLRILEGRRSRLEQRREGVRTALARRRERLDAYTLELQRHGLESVEREVRWLNELIATERLAGAATGRVGALPPDPADLPRSPGNHIRCCLLYTSPSPRDRTRS